MSTLSSQNDIINQVIWGNLSSFWTSSYDPENLNALSAVYEAQFNVLDAEMVRLLEINQAKSLSSCPVISQRRWLRLDLNKYAQLKQFLQYINLNSSVSVLPGNLANDAIPDTATRHWHISFPWQIDSAGANTSINMGFPILTCALVSICQMVPNTMGQLVGTHLRPFVTGAAPGSYDYTILPDGQTIALVNAQPADQFELTVAFDFTSSAYDDLVPSVFNATTFLGNNIISVPANYSNGLPVHVLVVHYAADNILQTNSDTYTARREFFPYTGDVTNLGGCQHGVTGQIVLNPSVTLKDTDKVFVFGLIKGEFTTVHQHVRNSVAITPPEPGLKSFTPSVPIPVGVFGAIDSLGQVLQLFVNGQLLSPTAYNFISGNNTFTFQTPLTGASLEFDVLFTSEQMVANEENATFHTHEESFTPLLVTKNSWATFDDGGFLDDGGIFDEKTYVNTATLVGVNADPSTVDIFINGILAAPSAYTITVDGKNLIVLFTNNTGGASVLVTYRRENEVYNYGMYDIVPSIGALGISPAMLTNLLANLQGFISSFEQKYGTQITDLSVLLEAAVIAANGGNPLLALFYDEFQEYNGINVNAANEVLTAANARNIESADTDLVDIPFLVDHVLHPTIRLQSGKDFFVIDGEIQSNVNLTASRGSEDANPGVWWCPLVALDEHLLAKNFGLLVNDVKDSTVQYKNSLLSNFQLRYGGPNMATIANTAAVVSGSPMFTQDSTIQQIQTNVTGYIVTVQSDNVSTEQQIITIGPSAPLPYVGMSTYTGQSIGSPLIVDTTLASLVSFSGNQLVVSLNLYKVQVGDKVSMNLYDKGNNEIIVQFIVQGISITPILGGAQTTLIFDKAPTFTAKPSGFLRVYRDMGAPYAAFDGIVKSIVLINTISIITSLETFVLPAGSIPQFNVGDRVYRGMAVMPNLAMVYDDTSKPDWYLTKPPTNEGAPASYNATLTPPTNIGGYTLATFSAAFSAPPAGTAVEFTNTNTQRTFTYIGAGPELNTALLSPAISAQMIGSIVVEEEAQTSYFEVNPTTIHANIGYLNVSTTLSGQCSAGDLIVNVASTDGFPAVGRVNVVLSTGSLLEFEYLGINSNQFLGVTWRTPFTALLPTLTDPITPVVLTLPSNCTLSLAAAYEETRISVPFLQALTDRIEYSQLNSHAPKTSILSSLINSTTAAQLYNLIKGTTGILQVQTLPNPATLTALIADTMPAGSTLEIIPAHAINDVYMHTASDSCMQQDEMTIEIIPSGSAGRLALPEGTPQVLLQSVITDPSTSVPYVYLWELDIIQGSGNEVLSSPNSPSTLLNNMVVDGVYEVTLTIANSAGQTRVVNLEITS